MSGCHFIRISDFDSFAFIIADLGLLVSVNIKQKKRRRTKKKKNAKKEKKTMSFFIIFKKK